MHCNTIWLIRLVLHAYRSEVDEVNIELIKIHNELEAHKKAFPEGTKEQKPYGLNEKNASDFGTYEKNESSIVP